MKYALIILALVFSYAFYNYNHKSQINKKVKIAKVTKEPIKYPNTQDGVVAYVEHVINSGSNRFNFPGGEMEGGYIPKEKARAVACYVYELSGRKCTKSYDKDAPLYFSSSCASCHGIDAKGVGGSYPDLTKNPLLGVGF